MSYWEVVYGHEEGFRSKQAGIRGRNLENILKDSFRAIGNSDVTNQTLVTNLASDSGYYWSMWSSADISSSTAKSYQNIIGLSAGFENLKYIGQLLYYPFLRKEEIRSYLNNEKSLADSRWETGNRIALDRAKRAKKHMNQELLQKLVCYCTAKAMNGIHGMLVILVPAGEEDYQAYCEDVIYQFLNALPVSIRCNFRFATNPAPENADLFDISFKRDEGKCQGKEIRLDDYSKAAFLEDYYLDHTVKEVLLECASSPDDIDYWYDSIETVFYRTPEKVVLNTYKEHKEFIDLEKSGQLSERYRNYSNWLGTQKGKEYQYVVEIVSKKIPSISLLVNAIKTDPEFAKAHTIKEFLNLMGGYDNLFDYLHKNKEMSFEKSFFKQVMARTVKEYSEDNGQIISLDELCNRSKVRQKEYAEFSDDLKSQLSRYFESDFIEEEYRYRETIAENATYDYWHETLFSSLNTANTEKTINNVQKHYPSRLMTLVEDIFDVLPEQYKKGLLKSSEICEILDKVRVLVPESVINEELRNAHLNAIFERLGEDPNADNIKEITKYAFSLYGSQSKYLFDNIDGLVCRNLNTYLKDSDEKRINHYEEVSIQVFESFKQAEIPTSKDLDSDVLNFVQNVEKSYICSQILAHNDLNKMLEKATKVSEQILSTYDKTEEVTEKDKFYGAVSSAVLNSISGKFSDTNWIETVERTIPKFEWLDEKNEIKKVLAEYHKDLDRKVRLKKVMEEIYTLEQYFHFLSNEGEYLLDCTHADGLQELRNTLCIRYKEEKGYIPLAEIESANYFFKKAGSSSRSGGLRYKEKKILNLQFLHDSIDPEALPVGIELYDGLRLSELYMQLNLFRDKNIEHRWNMENAVIVNRLTRMRKEYDPERMLPLMEALIRVLSYSDSKEDIQRLEEQRNEVKSFLSFLMSAGMFSEKERGIIENRNLLEDEKIKTISGRDEKNNGPGGKKLIHLSKAVKAVISVVIVAVILVIGMVIGYGIANASGKATESPENPNNPVIEQLDSHEEEEGPEKEESSAEEQTEEIGTEAKIEETEKAEETEGADDPTGGEEAKNKENGGTVLEKEDEQEEQDPTKKEEKTESTNAEEDLFTFKPDEKVYILGGTSIRKSPGKLGAILLVSLENQEISARIIERTDYSDEGKYYYKIEFTEDVNGGTQQASVHVGDECYVREDRLNNKR